MRRLSRTVFLSLFLSSPLAVAQDLTCGFKDFQKEVMDRVNLARSKSRKCGKTTYPKAPPLKWNSRLAVAAYGHSKEMADRNFFDHRGWHGSTFTGRIEDAGYQWGSAGENIAVGQRTIQKVIESWIQSPGHCANIMKSTFQEVGVACVYDPDTKWKMHWTMDLARPKTRRQ